MQTTMPPTQTQHTPKDALHYGHTANLIRTRAHTPNLPSHTRAHIPSHTHTVTHKLSIANKVYTYTVPPQLLPGKWPQVRQHPRKQSRAVQDMQMPTRSKSNNTAARRRKSSSSLQLIHELKGIACALHKHEDKSSKKEEDCARLQHAPVYPSCRLAPLGYS
jgi:hypothetical protein